MAGSSPHDAESPSGRALSRCWAGIVPNPLRGGLAGSDARSQPFNVDYRVNPLRPRPGSRPGLGAAQAPGGADGLKAVTGI